MARGGATYPVKGIGVHGWTGYEWIEVLTEAGGLSVNLKAWGGTPLTGRDVTTDLQSLADTGVVGVLRTMGDAGAGALDTGGRTILRWLNDLLESIDFVGAAPVNAATAKTVRRLLEDILAASGGAANEHYQTVTTVCAAADSAPGALAQPVEYLSVIAENADLEIKTTDLSAVPNATYIVVKRNSFAVIPAACSDFVVRNRGGVAAPVATAIVTGYYN